MSKNITNETAPTPEPTPPVVKKYDMAALQIKPRYLAKGHGSLSLRLPGDREFFRVNPFSRAYFNLLEDTTGNGKRYFILDSGLVDEVGSDGFEAEVLLAANLNGEIFLLFCKLPSRPDEPWATSRLNVVEAAETEWVRMVRAVGRDGYEALRASGKHPEPTWPAKSFMEILEDAAPYIVIDDRDHYLLRRLRGEA